MPPIKKDNKTKPNPYLSFIKIIKINLTLLIKFFNYIFE